MIQEKYLKNNYPLILIGLYPLALMIGTFISELIKAVVSANVPPAEDPAMKIELVSICLLENSIFKS